MDSMRHLSTSLPKPQRQQDQSDLLSDFKAAALSVTNLYKTAALSQAKVRNAGYQDALDDLLAFLDKENLGLMDGEGRRVRRWATEKWNDGAQRQSAASDEDDDATAARRQTLYEQRSSSPETQKKSAAPTPSVEPKEEPLPPKPVPVEISQLPSQPPSVQPSTVPSADLFTFRSQIHYPTNHERAANPMDLDPASTNTSSPPSSTDAVRYVSRSHRKRHTNANRRENRSTINLNVSGGAGSKRKFPYTDFFDVSDINFEWQDGKDGGKSGKRGRHA